MKPHLSLIVAIGLMAAPATFARPQETSQETTKKTGSEGGEDTKTFILLWANFLVLAAGLGYLAVKNGGPFFAARARKIRHEMVEAGDLRKNAEARVAEIERSLASFEKERAALREESEKEIEAQRHRMRAYTADEIAKIESHTEHEVESAGKLARAQLKQYSAELAIALAEQKVRARMSSDVQDALVQGFVRNLGQPASRVQTN